MTKPGPKPTPTAIKKLRGNPGKRPLNDAEPRPRMVKPRCPSHLSDEAKKEWKRISSKLFDLGLLTEIDGTALAIYCELWARWVEANKRLAESNIVIRTTNGNLVQNPLVGMANRAMTDMLKVMAEFGMTPSSRSRVKSALAEEEKSLAEMLFESVPNE